MRNQSITLRLWTDLVPPLHVCWISPNQCHASLESLPPPRWRREQLT